MGTAPATVQHVTKASSDELLRKFAQVGSQSKEKLAAKKELQLAKCRQKRIRTTNQESDEQCESPSNRRASLVEMKSLLPLIAANRRSSALIRRLGIGRSRLRARDFKNKSILGTIEKLMRKRHDCLLDGQTNKLTSVEVIKMRNSEVSKLVKACRSHMRCKKRVAKAIINLALRCTNQHSNGHLRPQTAAAVLDELNGISMEINVPKLKRLMDKVKNLMS